MNWTKITLTCLVSV
jgi:hypothetical protein